MFVEKFKITGVDDLAEPKFKRFTDSYPWKEMSSGLYNDGLVTIIDQNYDESFMSSWSWLIGDKTLLIATLCWGDFIYVCSNERQLFIVLVDQRKRFALGNSLLSVFDKNIATNDFEQKILRPDEFIKFIKKVGYLEYGECYAIDNNTGEPTKRSMSTYLDILGQTGMQGF